MFDTAEAGFNFAQMFSENRFIGGTASPTPTS
jgi:hypothetical protein